MEVLESKNEIKKSINPNSLVMDINTLKAPLFIYENYKPVKDVGGVITQKIEEREYKWVDSKNQNRKLYMYCKGRLPRSFESDTLHGLMGLFTRKHAPFPYNDELGQYEINVSKLEFSWYELCNYMNVPSTGYYIERLKEAIRILKQTQYFSYESGVMYDKSSSKYVKSGEEGISLITKYKFKTVKAEADNDEYSTEIDNNFVIFDELILNNLRYEYFKYLDSNLFFSLIPSGIERGIYGYLEANRYDENGKPLKYVKRFYDKLRVGIPLEFKFPYEVKKRLEKPLNHLIQIGYLKDYAFGEVLKINGEKEQCVYFCFDIEVDDLKNMLERKKLQQLKLRLFEEEQDEACVDIEDNVSKSETYLKVPDKPLQDVLEDVGMEKTAAYQLVITYDKWDIIKYIIWINKQTIEGKNMPNKPGLLRFAIEKPYPLGEAYKDILDFVETQKSNEIKTHEDLTENIKTKYDEYIVSKVEKFKSDDEVTYNIFYEDTYNNIVSNLEYKISNLKAIKGDVSKYEEFKTIGTESELFKNEFHKTIKMYLELMDYNEFQNEMINKGNIS